MLVPLRTDSPLRRTPYMNWAIIAANVAVFLVQQSNPRLIGLYGLSPREPTVPAFITYAFLHEGWLHIIGNMLFLWIFGNNVNDKMGHVGYLAFYMAGAVAAGLGYVITQNQDAAVVGASGAIAAVTGAYLVLFPRSNVTVFYFYFFVGQAEIPSLWFILFFFGYDVFLGVRGGDHVAHSAHIGGTLFGFLICFVLLMIHLLPRDQYDIVALLQRWNKRRQYRDLVQKGYNPFDYSARARAPARPPPPDPVAERAAELRSSIAEAVARHDLATAGTLYVELKSLDPQQVLPRQMQLDVANHLAAEHQFPQAAEAYESFLRAYPKYEQIEQVELMLGLIYARYLNRFDLARQYLGRALARLHGQREIDLAREELARIGLSGSGAS